MFAKILNGFTERKIAKFVSGLMDFAKEAGRHSSELETLSEEEFAKAVSEAKELALAVLRRAGSIEAFSRRPHSRSPEVARIFALVREAGRRRLGMRHFDVQLAGGMVLHEGAVSEMRTGEGKTLVITLPAILNALAGIPVHVVTVNEYLAGRDSERMRPVYEAFGLSVGLLRDGMEKGEKRAAYMADIVYGVNHEFGFDYLRDNMAVSQGENVMRGLGFSIIDEVDSILVDEARTPLIISGEDGDDTELYRVVYDLTKNLRKADVEIDLKTKQAMLTEAGFERMEGLLCSAGVIADKSHLYEARAAHVMRVVQACMSARFILKKDRDYVVTDDGGIAIVDEFTGRLMADRRWSNGIHQALEAKEGVEVKHETKTLATITYQNFFRLYGKKCGLTGTASTQAAEFAEIYGMDVVPIPTNRPMIRIDRPDVIYRHMDEKFEAIAEEMVLANAAGRPVLAGTSSIADSERLSAVLTGKGLEHSVLNAKNHEREASIISAAGRMGAVTVATNMAGRGTDIILGGSPEGRDPSEWETEHNKVVSLGGLYVIGSARHESRRIDNQLRGRSGRQGDPGESRFILSLDDDLFRAYAQNGFLAMIDKHNMMPRGSSLEHPFLNKSLDRAQAAVEHQHFSSRKQILEYDNVAAEQRRAVYAWRDEILMAQDCLDVAVSMLSKATRSLVEPHFPEGSMFEQWDAAGLAAALRVEFGITLPIGRWAEESSSASDVADLVEGAIVDVYVSSRMNVGGDVAELERSTILSVVDEFWQAHLTEMGHLMEGIHLRAYAQKDPKMEYKSEAFAMFGRMAAGMAEAAAASLMRIVVMAEEETIENPKSQNHNDGAEAGPFPFSSETASSEDQSSAAVS